MEPSNEPKGELVIRTIAMPADTNPNGDIFWRLDHVANGSGQRNPRRENGEDTRRHCGDGRDVIPPAGARGRYGGVLCLGRKNRPHVDDDPGRSLGSTLHEW